MADPSRDGWAPESTHSSLATPQLHRCLSVISQHPRSTAGLCLALTILFFCYALLNLGINSDNLSLVSEGL